MRQISINYSTYAKLMQLAMLTNQDPEMWADAVLFRMVSEEIKAALEKHDRAAGTVPIE
jgi:hypothetical protein